MSEQSVNYITEHPQAIQDAAKAELMAYASAGQEEELASQRAKALEAAKNMGNADFRGEGSRGAGHAATHHAEQAEKARIKADAHALGAAAIYDKVKGL